MIGEAGHDGDGDELYGEECGEPWAAFFDHLRRSDVEVRLAEGLDAGEFVDVFGGFLFGDVDDVVVGDDADEEAAAIDDGECGAVVAGHHADGFFAVGGGVEGEELLVHEALDGGVGVGEEELADEEVVDELEVFVDDVDPVERFGVAAEVSHVFEGACDGPGGFDADVVRGHESADLFGAVAEDGVGLAA